MDGEATFMCAQLVLTSSPAVQVTHNIKAKANACWHLGPCTCIWKDRIEVWSSMQSRSILHVLKVDHRLPKTCSVSETGHAGSGTVLDFGTPQHTMYPYCSVAGIHRYISKVI